MTEQTGASRADKVAALRDCLDSLDVQTRRPGEPPLREAVAQQARERLAEMDASGEQGTVTLCAVPGHHGHDYRQCPVLAKGS